MTTAAPSTDEAVGKVGPANDVPASTLPEVLTVAELAVLLRLHPKSIYAKLSANPLAIPGVRKVAGAWRAHRPTVVAWLASGQIGVPRPQK